jgi:hypothetical protein
MCKLGIFYALLGLLLGFFIIYLILPSPQMIIKYPNIDNIHNTTYVDENGLCYKYHADEVACTN